MSSFVFRWPYEAKEVFVTGTFDDWGKTVQLEKKGDVFEKEVPIPLTAGKIQYKFVVDGEWVTDSNARQENDGQNNINNVLLPEDLKPTSHGDTAFSLLTGGNTAAAVMAGVTPESTTANLAANVPKETSPVPGGFPETPANEVGELSVNPIPASGGIGNPVKLNPGEPVPPASTLHNNTVESTVRTDKAGYEADASTLGLPGSQAAQKDDAFSVPPIPSSGLIPESSLPQYPPETNAADPSVTIQSAHPTSTTAALAAQVPLESQKDQKPVNGVPDVVKQSLSQAHQSPEAAANAEAVMEKTALEAELQNKVETANGPAGVPATEVPTVVKASLEAAHKEPEAAANVAAVEEKKEVEQELQQKVATTDEAGEPAPTNTAATSATAPGDAAKQQPVDSTSVSPRTTTPALATQGQTQPTVTTGVAEGQTAKTSEPVGDSAQDGSKDKKKKHRASGFFQKLKERFK